ncbi:FAD binding domain protein [Penicillium canescens]|nr:FAD binding domain protein [Penicillium canescens]
MKAELQDGNPPYSANPAFRETLMHAITSTSWRNTTSNAAIESKMDHFTNDILGKWRSTGPDAGAYMSETDIQEPSFQQAFYGTNYTTIASVPSYILVLRANWCWERELGVESSDGLPDQNGR